MLLLVYGMQEYTGLHKRNAQLAASGLQSGVRTFRVSYRKNRITGNDCAQKSENKDHSRSTVHHFQSAFLLDINAKERAVMSSVPRVGTQWLLPVADMGKKYYQNSAAVSLHFTRLCILTASSSLLKPVLLAISAGKVLQLFIIRQANDCSLSSCQFYDVCHWTSIGPFGESTLFTEKWRPWTRKNLCTNLCLSHPLISLATQFVYITFGKAIPFIWLEPWLSCLYALDGEFCRYSI